MIRCSIHNFILQRWPTRSATSHFLFAFFFSCLSLFLVRSTYIYHGSAPNVFLSERSIVCMYIAVLKEYPHNHQSYLSTRRRRITEGYFSASKERREEIKARHQSKKKCTKQNKTDTSVSSPSLFLVFFPKKCFPSIFSSTCIPMSCSFFRPLHFPSFFLLICVCVCSGF